MSRPGAERRKEVDDALAAMNGRPAAEHAGRRVEEGVSDLGEEVAGILRRVLASGQPVVDCATSGTSTDNRTTLRPNPSARMPV